MRDDTIQFLKEHYVSIARDMVLALITMDPMLLLRVMKKVEANMEDFKHSFGIFRLSNSFANGHDVKELSNSVRLSCSADIMNPDRLILVGQKILSNFGPTYSSDVMYGKKTQNSQTLTVNGMFYPLENLVDATVREAGSFKSNRLPQSIGIEKEPEMRSVKKMYEGRSYLTRGFIKNVYRLKSKDFTLGNMCIRLKHMQESDSKRLLLAEDCGYLSLITRLFRVNDCRLSRVFKNTCDFLKIMTNGYPALMRSFYDTNWLSVSDIRLLMEPEHYYRALSIHGSAKVIADINRLKRFIDIYDSMRWMLMQTDVKEEPVKGLFRELENLSLG
jgi:hypothetical protein